MHARRSEWRRNYFGSVTSSLKFSSRGPRRSRVTLLSVLTLPPPEEVSGVTQGGCVLRGEESLPRRCSNDSFRNLHSFLVAKLRLKVKATDGGTTCVGLTQSASKQCGPKPAVTVLHTGISSGLVVLNIHVQYIYSNVG